MYVSKTFVNMVMNFWVP